MASKFEQIVDAIHEKLADPRVSKGIFRKALSKNEGPFRVVWIPPGGNIGPATTPGVRGDNHVLPTMQRITSLSSKSMRALAFITAPTFEQLEILHDNVLLAAYLATNRAVRFGSFENLSEAEDRFGFALGERCGLVQEFEFDVVVAKEIRALALVTNQAITDQTIDYTL